MNYFSEREQISYLFNKKTPTPQFGTNQSFLSSSPLNSNLPPFFNNPFFYSNSALNFYPAQMNTNEQFLPIPNSTTSNYESPIHDTTSSSNSDLSIANPNERPSLKRPREEHINEIFPYLPLEVWSIIWFNLLEFNSPTQVCSSINKIQNLRSVCMDWNTQLSINKISIEIKAKLEAYDIDLHQIIDNNKSTALSLACKETETELAEILIKSSKDPNQLLKACSDIFTTPFYYAIIHISTDNMKNIFKTLLSCAVNLNLDLYELLTLVSGNIVLDHLRNSPLNCIFNSEEWDTLEFFIETIFYYIEKDFETMLKILNKAIQNENVKALQVIVEILPHKQLRKDLAKKIFVNSFEDSEIKHNPLTIPYKKHHLVVRVINFAGEYAWEAISFQSRINGKTPLHAAIDSRSTRAIYAIVEKAGSRIIELLEKVYRVHQGDFTPIEYARFRDEPLIAQYLENLKAQISASINKEN